MNYLVDAMKNTPSLQNFQIKPESIELTTGEVKIPLYLNNSKQAS
jgi:hypothetical protein